MSWARNRRTPTRTQRFRGANAGNSTGRESYEFGTPVVVRGWESQLHGEGATLERGPELPLDKGRQGRYREVSTTEACAMQDTNVYLGLLHERGKRGLPLKRVYRQLFNPKLYLTAYGKIYRNAGAMTPGVTKETVDGMSEHKINAIIGAMRAERYHWKPARRTYILKKNGKKRPLGLPVWSDKLVAEVLRMILEAYFEPRFSPHSHGFRPGRGCHTALQEIYYQWAGTTWFIEGEIAGCFDNLNHELLISTLKEHIHDGRFIKLIQNLLDAGYLEDWNYHRTLSGVPQGSIVSPVLSNILLDKLDTFVETVLIPKYTKGTVREKNPTYRRLVSQAHERHKQGRGKEARTLRKQFQRLPSQNPNDPNFRRLRYCRYADDFLLGFVGPKAEAEEIKEQIKTFLQDELKLELSETKTLITHARSEAAHFLGYEISTLHKDTKRITAKGGTKRRSINGQIGLRVPREVLLGKCSRYKRRGKAFHRAELMNESDYSIVSMYQSEYRGIVNYYRLAYNLHTLQQLKWTMEQSLTKTLAHKHKQSSRQVRAKYQTDLEVDGTIYKGLQVIVEREGKKPLVATWGGIPLKWESQATLEDQPQQRVWTGRSDVEKRLKASRCEQCGATSRTEQIEVHHIRALKDLNRYPGREKPAWVKLMATRHRKTLVLCRTCHMAIQYGHPVTRHTSSP
jgi:group II intron reverse transcriptase/maturase